MVPGSGRYPGVGNGNRLQDSCLKNSMDRGAWRAAVHGVSKSWTLKEFSTAQRHMRIMSFANSDCLASSFPTWDSFYFIFFFSDIIRISIAMLKKVVRVAICVLFLNLEEMFLAFYHWYGVNCWLIYSLYYVEVCFLYINFMKRFLFLIINRWWILSFFVHLLR